MSNIVDPINNAIEIIKDTAVSIIKIPLYTYQSIPDFIKIPIILIMFIIGCRFIYKMFSEKQTLDLYDD